MSPSRRKSAPKRGRRKIRQRRSEIASTKFVVGTLKTHREGYGFLLPDAEGEPDVFIPQRRMKGAMDGDQVKVSVWKSSGKRFEGAVEEIIQRGKKFLVGILERRERALVVCVPVAEVKFLFNVDREELRGAKLGETVGIEVVDYPEEGGMGRARVIQLFGARGDEASEIDIVILKHQLPREFPKEVLDEAREINENRDTLTPPSGTLSQRERGDFPFSPREKVPAGRMRGPKDETAKRTIERKDLRKLPLVTIDGETARDFDDAICVKKEKDGGFRLWVSIADVSHYVRPGSKLNEEALKRGTSVYFSDKVIPMLPEELSNDLCSLRPHEDRLSFTTEITFDFQGKVTKTQFYKSILCSQARLTYNQVFQALIQKKKTVQNKISKVLPMLQEALALFQLLRKQRLERGSIDFDLPEPEIITDLEAGDTENIVKAERNEAHMLIEEFMIAANEAVARFITKKKTPSLYRIHEDPDPEKMDSFKLLLHNLGFSIPLKHNPKPKDLSKVIAKTKGHAEERLIQHLLLRSMKQAVYSTEDAGHYGLASDCYTHFTSPIRRYPDLVVHRILERILTKQKESEKKQKIQLAQLASVAKHTSRRERVAMEAEWEALDLKVALFMQNFIGEYFDGVIARVTKFGFFVELKEYFVTGLVALEDLADDYFVFEEKRYRLIGRRTKRIYKIGMEVNIRVEKVDIEERRVYFALN